MFDFSILLQKKGMKIYKIEEIGFSTFIYTQWVAYILSLKIKLIGYETFEVDASGNGKICGKTANDVIKMSVPKTEWSIL